MKFQFLVYLVLVLLVDQLKPNENEKCSFYYYFMSSNENISYFMSSKENLISVFIFILVNNTNNTVL